MRNMRKAPQGFGRTNYFVSLRAPRSAELAQDENETIAFAGLGFQTQPAVFVSRALDLPEEISKFQGVRDVQGFRNKKSQKRGLLEGDKSQVRRSNLFHLQSFVLQSLLCGDSWKPSLSMCESKQMCADRRLKNLVLDCPHIKFENFQDAVDFSRITHSSRASRICNLRLFLTRDRPSLRPGSLQGQGHGPGDYKLSPTPEPADLGKLERTPGVLCTIPQAIQGPIWGAHAVMRG